MKYILIIAFFSLCCSKKNYPVLDDDVILTISSSGGGCDPIFYGDGLFGAGDNDCVSDREFNLQELKLYIIPDDDSPRVPGVPYY